MMTKKRIPLEEDEEEEEEEVEENTGKGKVGIAKHACIHRLPPNCE